MSLVQVFLATYNRPKFVIKAINSVLNQDTNNYELIISDNSTNDETKKILDKEFSNKFTYKRRKPSLNAIEHFNLILSEVSAEYFLIFHDDDLMLPYMLSTLICCSQKHKKNNVIAVGANALLMKNNKITRQKFGKNVKKDLLINNPSSLAKQYLIKNGIVPLTSYLYKREVAESLHFNFNHGKKYCDVAFLLDVCSLGNIINLHEPLMVLNNHATQDSKAVDFEGRFKLINYVTKITTYKNSDKLIINYRLNSLYLEMCRLIKSDLSIFWSNRNLKVMKLMVKNNNFELLLKLIVKSFH